MNKKRNILQNHTRTDKFSPKSHNRTHKAFHKNILYFKSQ